MESSTKILRRLLDERGAEWMPSVFDPQHETFYSVDNGVGFIVTEFPEIQRMSLACDMRITPEQAVEATLGRGTCRITDNGPWGYPYVCSACGASFDPDVNNGEFNYCPNCGRRVVE